MTRDNKINTGRGRGRRIVDEVVGKRKKEKEVTWIGSREGEQKRSGIREKIM